MPSQPLQKIRHHREADDCLPPASERASRASAGTHVVVQEVLDGCVHVRRAVGTFDLTHGQAQAPAQHCCYPGNHPLNTCRVQILELARVGSDGELKVGRRSEGSAPARRSFIGGGSERHQLRAERERGWRWRCENCGRAVSSKASKFTEVGEGSHTSASTSAVHAGFS